MNDMWGKQQYHTTWKLCLN